MLTKEQIEKINYVNLVNHTHFSIPMGIGNVKAHLKRAQVCGFKGLAITDTHMMGGVLEAYKVCKEANFPLAMGVVLNVIDDLERKDKTNKAFTLTAFAKNAVGYRNLVTLTSIGSQDDHFYYKPRVSLPELIEHSEGIVVMSGDINGMLAQSILRETGQEEVLMQIFKEHFNEDFFIEMHCHNLKMQWEKDTKVWVDSGSDPQKIVNLKLIELARKYKVKCVLVQNTYFPEPKHKALQEILIGNTPIGKDGWRPHESFHTRQLEDLYQMIQEKSNYISDEQFLEWTENSMIVLDKCKDIKLSFTPKLPNIKYEESVVNQDPIWEDNFQAMKTVLKTLHPNMFELFEIAEEDISLKTSLKIMMKNAKVDFASIIHLDRLNEELRVIHRNGIIKLCDYFLLLEDVTHFVRSNGFLRGFGRGCLTGETKVITDKGFKNLKDMVEGDKVFTHKGNLKTVVKTFKYQVKEKLLEFKTENSWGNITLTKDHKIFGVKRELTKYAYDNKRKKYEEFEHKPDFYAAESFKVGDLLFVKTPDYVTKNLPDIDLASFIASEQNYKVFSKSIAVLNPLTGTEVLRFKREIKSSPEWVYLLGKWVGDGWYRYNEDKRRYDVGFAFNSKDTVEIERTIKFFEKHKFNVAKIEHKTKKLVQVVVYNKLLAKWFKSYFSEYKKTSGSKHLGDLKYLPKPLLTKLMKGYQSADGSISDNHYRQESVATTSPILVDDLKIAFMHLGIPVNITERQPYYRDNYLCNKSYTLKFMGLSRKRIARDYIIQEDGYYVKIKDIKEVKAQPVYDLMIGGEPSYTTSNFTVHNSGAGSLVAYALDITDCDPIHFDLLFERFLTKERVGKFNFELPNFPMNEYNKEKK